ncbi:cellulose biosynthesis protein BcsN [Mongoliimonas terrestris]|uniref:cellulose biosynthesis protein BcsN n=1 Tax=Mongoliimonas terrestris TaxID=1709001 RepID=UPI000B20C6CD|nr:cellulose biosynthesis protein BcsN [Mongoliimonas terrestris]
MCVPVRLLRRLSGVVGLWLSAGLLAGCVTTAPAPGVGAGAWGSRLAFQAAGLAVLGEVEKAYANGHERKLILATRSRVPGSNYVSAAFLVPGGGTGYGPRLDDVRPASSALDQELARAIPGVALGRTTAYGENAYGPYGYATGRSARGEPCVYGWQRIAGGSRLGQRAGGVVQVRLRVCDTRLTAARVDGLMQAYAVGAAARAAGGGSGRPGAGRFVDPDPVFADAPRGRRAPARAAAVPTNGMLALPELGGIMVPTAGSVVSTGRGGPPAAGEVMPGAGAVLVPAPLAAGAGASGAAEINARRSAAVVPPCAQPGLGVLCARPAVLVPPPVPLATGAGAGVAPPPGAGLRIPPPPAVPAGPPVPGP